MHDKPTIVSMTVVAATLSSLLHEGLGHGVTAWLRGDVVTELTSNHLSDLRPDRLVDAGGTLVNLIAGSLCMIAAGRVKHANTRYFLWILAALNLLPGAGYFLFSGILGLGDWESFIAGMPHQALLRAGMTVLGLVLYVLCVRWIGVEARPFVATRREYNTVGRLPYYAACAFWCVAGAFDPLGIKLMFLSTLPASFGGFSGLLWADLPMPRTAPAEPLAIGRSRAWWLAAILIGITFLATVARGIEFRH